MPTSAHYISVNKCENQRPKAMQPATKQSTGLFCQICKQIWSSLSLVRVNKKKKIRSTHTHAPKGHFTAAHQGCATCYKTVHRTVSPKFAIMQIWSSLSWFESKSKKTKRTEHTKVCSVIFGSPSWTRTNDPAVNSRMLYQLSY